MRSTIKLFFCICSAMLCSCSVSEEKVFDLNESEIREISFNELPAPVAEYINYNIDSIDQSDNKLYTSIDKQVTFSYGRSGMSDTWLNEVNSNYHHFFIDGVHYRLRGNKGAPFILYQGSIYFCSLNLYREDFKKRTYFKITLPEIKQK